MSNGMDNRGYKEEEEAISEKPHPLQLNPVISPMEAGPSTSSFPIICPSCSERTVSRRFTWKGILSAIFCFPCGIWCCFKTYARYQCSRCRCDIIAHTFSERSRLLQHGYHFKAFQPNGYTPRSHRNAALSVSSQTTDISTNSNDSQTPLIRRQQPE